MGRVYRGTPSRVAAEELTEGRRKNIFRPVFS
jgi:hypothetical protein